ncbi:MAG: site-2 protease family protein [Alphaproteobacteria bacterium]
MGAFSIVTNILVIAVPVIIAITFHEAAHGYVAWKLGDDTAYRLGRVTFNPIKHIDMFGTILLPILMWVMEVGFIFGYAKPVPVDFARLNRPRRDMVLVAAAGPGINLALAVVSAILLHVGALLGGNAGEIVIFALKASVLVNVLLAVFNMLPLPPLDGGRVAVGLLPDSLARPLARLERWGFPILIFVLIIVPEIANQLGSSFAPFQSVILPVVRFFVGIVSAITGVDAGLI